MIWSTNGRCLPGGSDRAHGGSDRAHGGSNRSDPLPVGGRIVEPMVVAPRPKQGTGLGRWWQDRVDNYCKGEDLCQNARAALLSRLYLLLLGRSTSGTATTFPFFPRGEDTLTFPYREME